jgi:hypothetical protein
MAAASPVGVATATAIADVISVALSSGSIPKCLSAKSTVHLVPVRNSITLTWVKNDTDSVVSVKKITMSATVETSDANKKVDWATLFIRFRR